MTVLVGSLWAEEEGQDIAEYAVMLARDPCDCRWHAEIDRLKYEYCFFQRRKYAAVGRLNRNRV